ncbi:MAG: LiaI-LiaF-like domain-containing protein [Terriglobales bacterium]
MNMSPQCTCQSCRTRGLLGPIVLITLGVLFALQAYAGHPFDRTWPILLIVIGVVKILQHLAPTTGHQDLLTPPGPPR